MSYLRKEKLDEEGEEIMKEYIEREAVADIVFRYSQVASEPPMDKEDKIVLKTLHKILDEVKQAPAADIEPVVHGEWIPIVSYFHGKPDGRYYCSVCHRVENTKSIYCRLCGAHMDGGNK